MWDVPGRRGIRIRPAKAILTSEVLFELAAVSTAPRVVDQEEKNGRCRSSFSEADEI